MWTNNITPGIWGECNTFTVGGPDTPIEASNDIGSAESIGGVNNTGTIPLDTLLNVTTTTTNNTATGTTTSNQTAVGNLSAIKDVVSPQPPVTTMATNNAPQTETTTAETALPVTPDEEQELGDHTGRSGGSKFC